MKIVALLRFPRAERAGWKRELIDGLIARGDEVALVFGEASYWRHARAALKEFGFAAVAKRNEIASAPQPKLASYFQAQDVPVKHVGDLNSAASERALRQLRPDVVLLLGTGIIRKPILDVPIIGTVHCHQGYLPTYRGVNTIEWAIYHGDDVHITTHFVDPGIDTGRILHRQRIPLYAGDDVQRVRERCKQAAVPLLLQTLDDIRAGTIEPIQQTADEGQQYFTMHPFFVDVTNRLLHEKPSANGH